MAPVPPLTVRMPATFNITSLGAVHPLKVPVSLTPITCNHGNGINENFFMHSTDASCLGNYFRQKLKTVFLCIVSYNCTYMYRNTTLPGFYLELVTYIYAYSGVRSVVQTFASTRCFATERTICCEHWRAFANGVGI